MGATVVTMPLVLHGLGVAGFGVWGAAASLAWLTGMLDLGLGSALVTLLPRVLAGGQSGEVAGLVAASLGGAAALGVVLGVGGAGLVVVFAGPGVVGPVLLAVMGLAVNVPLSIAGNVWFGLQKGFWAGVWELAQTGLTLSFLLLAVALHGGVLAMVAAVYGGLVLANAGSLAHLFWSHPQVRPGALARRNFVVVARQGGVLFAIMAAVSCTYGFDNLLTLHWLGAAASARMTVALRLCTTAAGLVTVVTQPLWPAFVDAAAKGDARWAVNILVWGTAAVAVLAGGGAVLIGLFGAAVLRWWLGADIGVGPGLLWWCGAWIFVLCVPRVAGLLFNAASILRLQLVAALLALPVAFGLKFLLAPVWGVAGILAGTVLAWVLVVWPMNGWRLARWARA
jgi:O-antigen/teichoic acid export membrane protein